MGLCAKPVCQGLICKNMLDGSLDIVEIPSDSADPDVAAELRGHLQALDIADFPFRVENRDRRSRAVGKSCQGCLSGVAAGSCEDHDAFTGTGVCGLSCGRSLCHEPGEYLEGDIFEGACRAMEEFKDVMVCSMRTVCGCKPVHWGDARIVKGIPVCASNASVQFLPGKIGQERMQHCPRNISIAFSG